MNKEKQFYIDEFNELRKKLTKEEFTDSILMLPPTICFYISKLKKADENSNLEMVRDYLIWKEFFGKLPIESNEMLEKQEKFYQALYEKYDLKKDNVDIKHIVDTLNIKTKVKKFERKAS